MQSLTLTQIHQHLALSIGTPIGGSHSNIWKERERMWLLVIGSPQGILPISPRLSLEGSLGRPGGERSIKYEQIVIKGFNSPHGLSREMH